eukprot:TRINITY_DN6808_c0_g1_i3.p1 TRINITY_DN6808_c0_g1~~TRINITY_DN6808_c0_g1_i3.p1  ORF type:complete len:459 (-),score=90.05 TRINITY_DN6808_c0_g1_i3:210-1586(-)
MPREKKEYTMDQVSQHNKKGDAWIVLDNQVYDVSLWAHKHPGGNIIFKFLGRDASEEFWANHMPSWVQVYLERFHIGSLQKEPDMTAFSKDYRALAKYFRDSGWYETSYLYFIAKFIACMSFLPLTLYTIVHYNSLPAAVLSGVLMALFWHQTAFITHDSLHNGISHNRKWDHFIGWFTGSVCVGIPAFWWKENHHMHHNFTNLTEWKNNTGIDDSGVEKSPVWNGDASWHGDPQMIYTPIWYSSRKIFQGFTLPVIMGVPLGQALLAIQHLTFLPLHLFIGRPNILLLGAYNVLSQGDWMEIFGLGLFWSYFTYIMTLVAAKSTAHLLIFLVVSSTLVGILHLQLNLSHFGEPMFTRAETDKMGFAQTQVLTARNIWSNWLTHWFHGGLQYQLEHHLFPMMPRHNLGAASLFVKDLCKRHNIPYQCDGFLEATKIILNDLQAIAADPLGDAPHPHHH